MHGLRSYPMGHKLRFWYYMALCIAIDPPPIWLDPLFRWTLNRYTSSQRPPHHYTSEFNNYLEKLHKSVKSLYINSLFVIFLNMLMYIHYFYTKVQMKRRLDQSLNIPSALWLIKNQRCSLINPPPLFFFIERARVSLVSVPTGWGWGGGIPHSLG